MRGPGPSGLSLPSLPSPPLPAGAPGSLSAPRRRPGGGSRKPAAVLSRRRGTSWTRVKVQTRWESSSKETAPHLLWFRGLQVFQGFQLVNVWTLQPPGGAPGLPGGGSGVRKLPIRKGPGVPFPWLPDEKRQVSPRGGVFRLGACPGDLGLGKLLS